MLALERLGLDLTIGHLFAAYQFASRTYLFPACAHSYAPPQEILRVSEKKQKLPGRGRRIWSNDTMKDMGQL